MMEIMISISDRASTKLYSCHYTVIHFLVITSKGESKMKNARYTDGVIWIANNDEPTILDPEEIKYFISTQLLADLFAKDRLTVAWDISAYRRGTITRTFANARRKIAK